MAKLIYEQFDGGLQSNWFKTSSTNRARKSQSKNGVAYGCTNPFIHPGVLVPGAGSRTSVTSEATITGSANYIQSILPVNDENFGAALTSTYFGQQDDFHALASGTVQSSGFPLTLSTGGAHGGHSVSTTGVIENILDYQVNGARKQLIFWRDESDWDCAYYSGIPGGQGTTTMTIASPCVVSRGSHGLVAGDAVKFATTGALPTGITAGTVYYVISAGLATSTFQISATKGGAAVNTSGTQSGTHTLYPALQTEGMSAATGYSASMILPNVLKNAHPKRRISAVTSDNGFCYFSNGSLLHKFDGTSSGGTNGTITGSVLSLSVNREILDMVDNGGRLWILTRNVSSSVASATNNAGSKPSVVIWNRQSTIVNVEDNITIGALEVYGIYSHNGVVYVFAKGYDGLNKLYGFDGKNFQVVADIGSLNSVADLGNGQEVGIPVYGSSSVLTLSNGFSWTDPNSNVFWYGLETNESPRRTLHWISRVSTADTNSGGSGFCITGNSSVQIYSTYVTSSAVKFSYVDVLDASSDIVAAGIATYTSAVELPKLSTIDGVTIFFRENTNADTATTTVKIYNSWVKNSGANLVTKTIDHDVDIPRGWVYFPVSMINSSIVQLSFTYNGTTTVANSPQITRIEVDYTPTNKRK